MKNRLFIIFSLMMLCNHASGFCDSATKLSTKEMKTQMRNSVGTNTQYLENCMAQKIKYFESKLEKYKNELSNCQSEEEAQRLLKKIESTEKKIKELNDLISGVDLIKTNTTK